MADRINPDVCYIHRENGPDLMEVYCAGVSIGNYTVSTVDGAHEMAERLHGPLNSFREFSE